MNEATDINSSLNFPLPEGSKVYFLGIGGIGMSALARYFQSQGMQVSGYDKTETDLTKQLVAEGMRIHYNDDVSEIEKNPALIVYTPAIPKDHKGFSFYRNEDFPLMKRSEVLGMITAANFNICVAGTHGKTTTSAMIAHILRDSGFGCNAFLGGIASNYETNFWPHENRVCVAEADEYDRSFLQLNPDIAVMTAMDADHLDIYGTEEMMQDAFVEFTMRIKTGGWLLYKKGIARAEDFRVSNQLSYSGNDNNADVYAFNTRVKDGTYVFDVKQQDDIIKDVMLNMGGRHNIENAVAALAASRIAGVEDELVKNSIESFRGVHRRFEYVIRTKDLVMIDDYAHHPEELRALIEGAMELYPGKKMTVVFQPHLYTRTQDLAKGFAEVLEKADEVILLPIYPAREKPIPGVESEMILSGINNENRSVKSKEELMDWVKGYHNGLLVIAGAGDIDMMVSPIAEILNRK